jgi:hypothetical protein
MGRRNFKAVAITPGVNPAMGAADNRTIPTLPGGRLPKFLLLTPRPGIASNIYFVRLSAGASDGDNSVDFPIWADSHRPIILNCHGYSHIGWEKSAASDVNGALAVIPLSNF